MSRNKIVIPESSRLFTDIVIIPRPCETLQTSIETGCLLHIIDKQNLTPSQSLQIKHNVTMLMATNIE
jgi:hypothetical protein